MKKEDFIKLGLDEEAAKKCETASLEELKGFIPKIRFDEVNNDKKKLELDLKERDSQLETLKNSSGDMEAMKKQIETLQADNKAKEASHKAEIHKLKVDTAIDAALTSAYAKNKTAVKALLKDMDKAELLEDGTIKGLSEQLAALAKAEDSSFLFGTASRPTKGVQPAQSGNEEGKVDFSKMTYSQMAAYMAQNPDAKIE